MSLTRVGIPPLQPALPIVWDPTVVGFALAAQLRRCGITGRLPHGLLDELLAPWGCKRWGPTTHFRVPCDCGRLVRRLTLEARGWACSKCGAGVATKLETQAGRLLFGFRLGFRGRFLTRMHGKVVRLLLGKPSTHLGARRFQVVQAATVVVSYDPRTHEACWRPLGLVGHELGGQVLDVWLTNWASPTAYEARCRREIVLSLGHG